MYPTSNAASNFGKQMVWFAGKNSNFCTFQLFWSRTFLMYEITVKIVFYSDALHKNPDWLRPWCEIISWLFWNDSIIFIKTNLAIEFFAFSARQNFISKKHTEKLTSLYVSKTTEKANRHLDEKNTATGFLEKEILFRKKWTVSTLWEYRSLMFARQGWFGRTPSSIEFLPIEICCLRPWYENSRRLLCNSIG